MNREMIAATMSLVIKSGSDRTQMWSGTERNAIGKIRMEQELIGNYQWQWHHWQFWHNDVASATGSQKTALSQSPSHHPTARNGHRSPMASGKPSDAHCTSKIIMNRTKTHQTWIQWTASSQSIIYFSNLVMSGEYLEAMQQDVWQMMMATLLVTGCTAELLARVRR